MLVALTIAVGSAQVANATVISGSISDWQESGPTEIIGDGSNHVSLYWSINTTDKGWFYGSNSTSDSDVAFASGVSDISQITDASVYTFSNGGIGPHCDADCGVGGIGDFLVWQNVNSGHYGVLRVDDIDVVSISSPDANLSGTWWFQTDGTGDFSSTVVPIPAAAWLFGSALLGLGMVKRRKA